MKQMKNNAISIAQQAKYRALTELVIGENAKYHAEYQSLFERYKSELAITTKEKPLEAIPAI